MVSEISLHWPTIFELLHLTVTAEVAVSNPIGSPSSSIEGGRSNDPLEKFLPFAFNVLLKGHGLCHALRIDYFASTACPE